MKQEVNTELDYDIGAVVVNEDNGEVYIYESPYITLPKGYWIEADADSDFNVVHSEDGTEIHGDTVNEILEKYESYIDDCIDAMSDDYVSAFKKSKYYADKDIFVTDKDIYNTDRGNYDVLHWVTSNTLVATYSDYPDNFLR